MVIHRVVVSILLFVLAAPIASAHEFGLGLAAVEEGDDRFRPAISGHIGIGERWLTKAYYYGREYGPIKESAFILSGSYKLDIMRIFGASFLHAAFGLSFMNEQTTLDLPGDSSTENSINFGLNVGTFGDIPIPGPVFVRMGLESHFFLAGPDGAILLTTGRKAFITVTAGVKL